MMIRHEIGNISATVIADSISIYGHRMITLELEYPRFILAELNTHRMLSKNSASSRAIPLASMHKQIEDNMATPVYWGKNQPGMQAKEEFTGSDLSYAKYLWEKAIKSSIEFAKQMGEMGLHKQVANRVTEAGMMMKTIISGTEWANLLHLRDHPDAQPEFAALAKCIRMVMEESRPTHLYTNEWHVPYITLYRASYGQHLQYYDNLGNELTVEEARIISASCCAQVSYRKNDDSLEKAVKIYKQLIESTPAHASPVEHQATPIDIDSTAPYEPETWQKGVTHVSANEDLWSGNLRGWIQFRKLIPNEAAW